MPGSKRRLDEDTWLIFQSKKCKTNQLKDTIYESTLAKLRHGARAFFNPDMGQEPSWVNNVVPPETTSPARPTSLSNVNSNMRNVHLSGGASNIQNSPSNSGQHPGNVSICSECQWRGSNNAQRTFLDKCSFCDKLACHVNPCSNCGDNFCEHCYIRRYDDPSVDTYVCFSCLP